MTNNPYQPPEGEANKELPTPFLVMSWIARALGVVVIAGSAIRLYRNLRAVIPPVLEEKFDLVFRLLDTYLAMVSLLMLLCGVTFLYSSARWRNQQLRSAILLLILPVFGLIACHYLDLFVFSL